MRLQSLHFLKSSLMASRLLVLVPLFLLSLLAPQCAAAQFIPGEESEEAAVVSYRKVKSDSLQIRKSKLGPKPKKKVKSAAAAKKKDKPSAGTVKKQSRSREHKIDSVEYQDGPYRLGDRIIMRGDSGADVRTVARILVNKIYMDEDSVIYLKNGDVLYDGELYRSVRRFQRLNGMHDDGIIGPTLIKALRKRK